MASVFSVARYILEQLGNVSAWKLQKLCYYCQAWSLAWTGEPIFQEEFEAWRNGPVCRDLFRAHQGRFIVTLSDIPSGNGNDSLTDDQKDTIDSVLQTYGTYEPYELREQTHSENPWREARGDLPDDATSNAIITKSSMGEYYGSL